MWIMSETGSGLGIVTTRSEANHRKGINRVVRKGAEDQCHGQNCRVNNANNKVLQNGDQTGQVAHITDSVTERKSPDICDNKSSNNVPMAKCNQSEACQNEKVAIPIHLVSTAHTQEGEHFDVNPANGEDGVPENKQSETNSVAAMCDCGMNCRDPGVWVLEADMEAELSMLSDHADTLTREFHLELDQRDQYHEYDFLEMIRQYDLDDRFPPLPRRQSQTESGTPPLPPFPIGEYMVAECMICFTFVGLHLRQCCQFPVCDDCLKQYFDTQIEQGTTRIECLNMNCNKYIHKDEILARLEPKTKEKFYRFLVEANREPNIKTCPQCCHIMTVDLSLIGTHKVKKKGLKVVCPSCCLVWCFPCQAPWHEGVSCKVFRKGDRLLRQWAKEHHYGQANAQKCPRCKVYIQRSTGCDHMKCSKCKTNFCYRCGDRYIQLRFFGDHYSKLSIFGCKYRFKPEQPAQRKLIRGAMFGGQILVASVVGGLVLGVGAIMLGFGIFALPFYGGFKLRQKLAARKRRQRHLEAAMEWRSKLQDIRKRGDPYLDNWNHMTALGYTPPRMVYQSCNSSQGEELEISMPQSNTGNFEELFPSYVEYLKTESLEKGQNASSEGTYCTCEGTDAEEAAMRGEALRGDSKQDLSQDGKVKAGDRDDHKDEVLHAKNTGSDCDMAVASSDKDVIVRHEEEIKHGVVDELVKESDDNGAICDKISDELDIDSSENDRITIYFSKKPLTGSTGKVPKKDVMKEIGSDSEVSVCDDVAVKDSRNDNNNESNALDESSATSTKGANNVVDH